ncbi:uncharacterized protein O3C94_008643 [Discoglossus pictus]
MESMFQLQENSGSTVLLTNKTMQVSNKLLTLASPRPSGKWICRHMRINAPTIGTVWYLPVGWLTHIYLLYSCIQEMNITTGCSYFSAVRVLLALSVAAMLLFTTTILITVKESSEDEATGCKIEKRPTLKHLLPALRSQKYPVQALSAILLIHSYLLLQCCTSASNPLVRDADNDTLETEGSGMDVNISEASQRTALPSIPPGNSFTCLLCCVNFAIPLIFHSMQESDPVWQKERLWGFLYSVTLLLIAIKYLSSSFSFFVVIFALKQSSPSLLFQGSSLWLPALHVISALSVFLFSLFLKIYVELSCRVSLSSYSATNLTLRRKIRVCPSPAGVIFSTLLIVVCEVPFMIKLYVLSLKETEAFTLCLFAINAGFCFFCISVSVIVGLRRSCLTNVVRVKQRQTDSGVCMANSFVYQPSPTSSNAENIKC